MKKILVIGFVVMLSLCLSGCTGSAEDRGSAVDGSEQESAGTSETQKTTEEDGGEAEETVEAAAIEFDYDEFTAAYDENKAKAKKEYEGKLVHMIGWVDKVDEEYAIVGADQSGAGGEYFVAYEPVHVYLPVDELAELTPGDKVSVNGVFAYQYYGLFDALLNAQIIENMGQTA